MLLMRCVSNEDRSGQHSIRINAQWRVCFVWGDWDAYEVESVDYHSRLDLDDMEREMEVERQERSADFPPVHPGEVLREDFLRPLGMSQYALAKALAVPEHRISEIVNGKRAVTPDTALRLGRYFGTSAEFWLGMQTTHDLERARETRGAEIEATVRPRAA